MAHDKDGLLAALNECAALMEIHGENPFRVRAYEQGARALEALGGQPAEWLEQGTLDHIKGIGKGMVEKVEEWVATGGLEQLEQLRGEVPRGLLDMMQIPGLGPKKVKAVHQELGIDSLEKLEAAIASGALAQLPGFGEKTAEKILAGIKQRRQYGARHTLDVALHARQQILERLQALPAVGRIEAAGSLRRWRETIKDLDFVATSGDPAQVMKTFIETPGVEAVVAHGETKSSILLRGGVPVDLRVVEPEQFPAALVYFTGSRDHNIELRGRAQRMGFKLNEYGLFPEKDGKTSEQSVPLKTEADLYRHLGLEFIPPELREAAGEIEAAEHGTLPRRLIEAGDMAGVLHCHTTYSDGQMSVEELARACQRRGYQYLAICDHSQSAAYAGGLSPDAVRRQWDEIDAANEKLKGFHIFKGIESDILGEGELDYPDPLLAGFDLVVVSIHSRMTMDREAMTRRICRAMEHPAATILGHPTGRLLLKREPYQLDLEEVFKVAAQHNVLLEINAHPARLDLDWRYIRKAKEMGCAFAINPDAHIEPELDFIPLGVGIARKGWLEKDDVINTLSAKAFQGWLEKRKLNA